MIIRMRLRAGAAIPGRLSTHPLCPRSPGTGPSEQSTTQQQRRTRLPPAAPTTKSPAQDGISIESHPRSSTEPQDSYGYRPGRSPHDALAVCRERCWRYDWAIDLDVQKFFDEVPWDLIVRAVEAVTDCRWVLLYVKRWLHAPLQHPDGTLEQRSRGTPQGSAISPCLVNLFMHYAFDSWMAREIPGCPFERFADDVIVHCKSRAQAEAVLARIAQRMNEVGLRLHPDKTRIVYCKEKAPG